MISDAPIAFLLKAIDKMLGTFHLNQYVFATTVLRAGVEGIDRESRTSKTLQTLDAASELSV